VTHRSREKDFLGGGGGQTRHRGLIIGVQLGQLGASMVSLAGRGCDQAPRNQWDAGLREGGQALSGGRSGVDEEKSVMVSLLSACGLSADQQWGQCQSVVAQCSQG
jgi:hypothetical protein